ncbi:MAG TPA: hypothetical protein VF268_00580 [Gammaproteobacteria bacterium]
MKPHPLPILETLYKSIAWPWYYRKQLGLALLPSFLALAGLEFASLYTPMMNEGKGTWLFALISLPFGILYIITIHRFLILGPEATPKFGMFEWRGREWRYLLYLIGLSILLGVIAVIPLMALFSSAAGSGQSAFRTIIMLIVCLPALLMFARLSLVFPAIAINSNFSLAAVWQAGKGNTFRLAVIVYWMPAGAAILDYFLPDNLPQYVEAVVILTWVLLSYALWAIEIACLSFAYKYLAAPTGAAD